MSRNSALKVIDHALSGKEGIANSEKFVEILGFRTLFPLFMKEKRTIRFYSSGIESSPIYSFSQAYKKISSWPGFFLRDTIFSPGNSFTAKGFP